MKHMQVTLVGPNPPHFLASDILPPMMPNTMETRAYCKYLVDNLKLFLKETLCLMPSINNSMIRFWDTSVTFPDNKSNRPYAFPKNNPCPCGSKLRYKDCHGK